MPTCRVTAILWIPLAWIFVQILYAWIVGFVHCCYSLNRFHSCFYIGFLYLHICKRICNVLICFLPPDGLTWPNHVVLMTSYLVKFLFQIFAGFWAISMLKIDFLFFFSLLKSLHCKKNFEVFALQKNFQIFIVCLIKENGLFFSLNCILLILVKSNNGYCTKKKIYFKKWSRTVASRLLQ